MKKLIELIKRIVFRQPADPIPYPKELADKLPRFDHVVIPPGLIPVIKRYYDAVDMNESFWVGNSQKNPFISKYNEAYPYYCHDLTIALYMLQTSLEQNRKLAQKISGKTDEVKIIKIDDISQPEKIPVMKLMNDDDDDPFTGNKKSDNE